MGGGAKRWAPIATAAALVIALPLLAPSSGLSKAHCKKGSKAKRCKKKKRPQTPAAPQPIAGPAPNIPSPPAPPVLRAEINWAENADVDVHVWNATGTQHASVKHPTGVPGVTFSADDTDGSAGGGNEKVFAQPGDKLVVGICNNGSSSLRSLDTDAAAVVDATAYNGATAQNRQDLAIKPSEGSWAITTEGGNETPPGFPTDWCYPKRAEASWDNAADVDLHVFDALGNHASPAQPYGIPNAYVTADVTTNPSNSDWEEFIDQDFESNRPLYFYYCLEAVNGAPAALWEIDFFRYIPPITAESHLTQAPPTQGDDGFMGSIPTNATYPPPFTLPNYCP